MEALQVYVKAAHGRELVPLYANKTRWNGILYMSKRFLKIRFEIHKSLIDAQKSSMYPTESEIDLIEEVVAALDVVEATTRHLQGRKVTLAEADRVFQYTLKEIHELKTPFADRLYDALIARILERRHKIFSTAHAYLEKASIMQSKDLILPRATKKDITKFFEELFVRLYQSNEQGPEVID